MCQYLLRFAQCLGLDVMEAYQRDADGLGLAPFERFCEQKRDSLFGQFDEPLAHFCRAEGYETVVCDGFVPTAGDRIATSV